MFVGGGVHIKQEGKKTLERELARAKITANRVAVVVANEWKDANDKVMPVKQWLDERRFMQVSLACSSLVCFIRVMYSYLVAAACAIVVLR